MELSPHVGLLSLHLETLHLTAEHGLKQLQFLHIWFKHNNGTFIFKSWREDECLAHQQWWWWGSLNHVTEREPNNWREGNLNKEEIKSWPQRYAMWKRNMISFKNSKWLKEKWLISTRKTILTTPVAQEYKVSERKQKVSSPSVKISKDMTEEHFTVMLQRNLGIT